jgi:hypothetical protein
MIKFGSQVRHASGWVGTVTAIAGEVMGNRVITVKNSECEACYLECVLTEITLPGAVTECDCDDCLSKYDA